MKEAEGNAAWTRRRIGVASAGVIAALFALKPDLDAEAKRKKRKKRCERLRTRCNPNNDRKLCCSGLICGEVPELGGHHCCKWRYERCTDNVECCGNLQCKAGANRLCDLPG